MPKTKKEQPKKKFNLKKSLGVIILFLGIFGLTLSFVSLAYSVQLVRSYSVLNEHAKWDIAITNVSEAETKGGAKVVNAPTVNNLGLTDYVVSFENPGDSVKYTFEIKNNGDIDAKLVEFTKGNPTCKNGSDALDNRSDEEKEADSTLVCGNLEYKVTYEDAKDVAVNDMFAAKSTKKVVMTITYKEDSRATNGSVNVNVPTLTMLFK